MSRYLPVRPDLEHLRKQAKEMLAEMRQLDPSARLADAQHRLAREYGFPSWPKLKVHVQIVLDSSGSSSTAGETSPFAGGWIARPGSRARASIGPFTAASLEFEVVGDMVTIVDTVVDSVGPAQHRNVLHADGVERPAAREGYAIVARWAGPRRLEVSVKQGTSTEGEVAYEVSSDGKELTVVTADRTVTFERNQL